jgi:nicotinate-nucleotide--dimethylbenzimidazole phosphoribosyltransferase
LAVVGGAELAAMAAAALRVAHHGGVVIVDGVVSTAAMAAALAIEPRLRGRLVFAHTSGDAAHAAMLRALGARPLLDLGMRLGEGTGALAAVPIVRLATTLADQMQTFAEAAVPDRELAPRGPPR